MRRNRNVLLLGFAVMILLLLFRSNYLKRERIKNEAVIEDLSRQINVITWGSAKAEFPMQETLNSLIENYYRPRSDTSSSYYKTIDNLIQRLRKDRSYQNAFLETLDAYNDRLISRFKQDYPDFETKDILLFAYKSIQLTNTSISVLLNIEKGPLANRLTRLRQRINQKETPNKSVFLSILKRK